MQCDAFITAAVTSGGICGKPDIWAGKDADLATEKSGHSPEGVRRRQRWGIGFKRIWCQDVLTTNRVQTFDDVITSRIHLMIKYESLSPDYRRILPRIFLTSTS